MLLFLFLSFVVFLHVPIISSTFACEINNDSMSYIEKNLMNGESIVTRAQLHAVVYVWPVVLAIASFVVMGFAAFTESYAYPVGVGVVMLVIVAVAMMIYRSDIEILISQIGAGYGVQVIALILMMVIIAAAFMAPVSSVSISLEGKYFWLLKSLPIHTEDVFFSKILVNFVIIAVPSGISWILSAIVFKMTAVTVLEGIAVVLLTAYLVSALGILINLLFPKLVWDREAVVIKQSMSSFVAVLLGLGLSAGMFVLYFAKLYTVEPGILTLALIGLLAVLVLAVTALLMTWGKKRFGRLSN